MLTNEQRSQNCGSDVGLRAGHDLSIAAKAVAALTRPTKGLGLGHSESHCASHFSGRAAPMP
jgi:hypothetical protein